MKKKFLFFALLLAFSQGAWATALSGSGTESDPWQIGSDADWSEFCTNFTSYMNGHVKMTADLGTSSAITTRAGAYPDMFSGVFDGCGHTMRIENTSGGTFYGINNGTVKNLHITGSMTYEGQFGAGLSLYAKNNVTISNCHVSTILYSSYTLGNAYFGGIVGSLSGDGTVLTMENCLYDGTINASVCKECAGMVGSVGLHKTLNLSHCLINWSATPSASMYYYTFVGGYGTRNITSCYYSAAWGDSEAGAAQGTAIGSMTNSELIEALGSANWHEEGGKVVPIMTDGNVSLTANSDPENPGIYYCTFYDGTKRYTIPANVEAFIAKLEGTDLALTSLATEGQVIPEATGVILRANVSNFTLTPTDAAGQSYDPDDNCLRGKDAAEAAPANCYVISGHSSDNSVKGVGFYQYTGELKAHKAYTIYNGGGAAPKRMRFIFNNPTGIGEVQRDNVQSTKVLENGQLVIIKNGVRYNAQGMIVK